MGNYKIIETLTANHQAVKPISPIRNTSIFIVCSLIFIFLALLLMEQRDLSKMLQEPITIVFTVWFLVNSIFLAFAANIIGQPGRPNQRFMLGAAFFIYVLLIACLMGSAAMVVKDAAWASLECIMGVAILCSLPLLFFFNLAKKLAPTVPWLMGLLLGLSTASFGAFGIAFSCEIDAPVHLLISHFVIPASIFGGLGAVLGRKLLKW